MADYQLKITLSGRWERHFQVISRVAKEHGLPVATLARMLLVPAIEKLDTSLKETQGRLLDGVLVKEMDLFKDS
jgi:hypothetical protein